MKLSPLDIYNKEFRKSFSFRSYDQEEVNEFIEQVGRDYEALYNEVNRLKEENEEMGKQLKYYKEQEEKLRQALVAAQDAYSRRKEEAEREGKSIIQEANLRARSIIEESKQKIQEQYSKYQRLQEMEELFKVRFRALLEGHLRYLEQMEKDQEESKQEKSEELPESGG